jgi:hypothetical protein
MFYSMLKIWGLSSNGLALATVLNSAISEITGTKLPVLVIPDETTATTRYPEDTTVYHENTEILETTVDGEILEGELKNIVTELEEIDSNHR